MKSKTELVNWKTGERKSPKRSLTHRDKKMENMEKILRGRKDRVGSADIFI